MTQLCWVPEQPQLTGPWSTAGKLGGLVWPVPWAKWQSRTDVQCTVPSAPQTPPPGIYPKDTGVRVQQ